MKISQAGIDLIKAYEGYSAKAYVCPAGYLTIGYGHLIKDLSSVSITKPQAEALLRTDVATAEKSVNRLIKVPLRQNQFDALVSFVYNLGGGALQSSTLRLRINRGDTNASEEFHRWVMAKGHKLPGLIKRRAAEAALFDKR